MGQHEIEIVVFIFAMLFWLALEIWGWQPSPPPWTNRGGVFAFIAVLMLFLMR